jgi:hypothetical protein
MPPPKKALSPVSRAKADKRNARLQEKRAADLAASGGAKSVKRKATTEDEMPASGRRWIKFASAFLGRNDQEHLL